MRSGLPVSEDGLSGWAVFALVVPAVSLTVSALIYFLAKKFGKWFVAAIERSFGQVVLNVMAPDMATLGIRIASSLDELRESNSEDHRQTGLRLTAVEGRQTDVEHRLAAVEKKLNIRPPETRTRLTDTEGAHNG
jgi:hypothetical protein